MRFTYGKFILERVLAAGLSINEILDGIEKLEALERGETYPMLFADALYFKSISDRFKQAAMDEYAEVCKNVSDNFRQNLNNLRSNSLFVRLSLRQRLITSYHRENNYESVKKQMQTALSEFVIYLEEGMVPTLDQLIRLLFFCLLGCDLFARPDPALVARLAKMAIDITRGEVADGDDEELALGIASVARDCGLSEADRFRQLAAQRIRQAEARVSHA